MKDSTKHYEWLHFSHSYLMLAKLGCEEILANVDKPRMLSDPEGVIAYPYNAKNIYFYYI
jgi:hypothetical protein